MEVEVGMEVRAHYPQVTGILGWSWRFRRICCFYINQLEALVYEYEFQYHDAKLIFRTLIK